MNDPYGAAVAQALAGIPDGAFEIKQYNTMNADRPPLMRQIAAETDGKGRIEIFRLFPGIDLSLHQYLANRVNLHHAPQATVLEINHCRQGRVGWTMLGGAAVYLGAGDLCLHSMASCADSEMTLPLNYYEGITVTVDLPKLKTECPDILQEAAFSPDEIQKKFCSEKTPIGVPFSKKTERIFSPLYEVNPALRLAYYKLKAQEILLYLQEMQPHAESVLTQYGAQQTELIKKIRDFLVENLNKRFTIEELAKKYLINTSSLKTVFKAVYGLPIATYVKEYRMQQAMRLLRETDNSIAEISQQVGYETQGKFTKAFKDSVRLLPTEYRRLYRNQP